MNKNQMETYKKGEVAVWVIIRNLPIFFIIIIATVALFKECADNREPIDIGFTYIKTIEKVMLADSAGNGYLVYFTNDKLKTEGRIKEISHRQEVTRYLNNLPKSYNQKFTNAIDLDIYTLLDWINQKGIPKDLAIGRIIGQGKGKTLRYLQPNPNDSTYTTEIIKGSLQGMVFLSDTDISNYTNHRFEKIYRYWGCSETSTGHDEQFTHIP